MNRLLALRTGPDADGVSSLPSEVSLVALQINDLLQMYPLDSLECIESRANRDLETGALQFYRQCDPDQQAVLYETYRRHSLVCMSIGASTGAFLALTLVPLIAGVVAGPVAAVISLIIGVPVLAGIGAAAGASGGAIDITVRLKTSDVYIKWVEDQKLENNYAQYLNYLQTYLADDAPEFLCPISHDFCKTPAISPNGHTYDLNHICAWLDRKEAEIAEVTEVFRSSGYTEELIQTRIEALKSFVCPMRGPYFTKSDLKYSRQYVQCVRVRLGRLILETEDAPAIVKLGVQMYVMSLKRTENMILSQKITLLTTRMNQLNMSSHQQETHIQQLLEQESSCIN